MVRPTHAAQSDAGQATGGGGIDKCRMNLSNKSTDAIVYDNQMGAPDSANLVTSGRTGSTIVIEP